VRYEKRDIGSLMLEEELMREGWSRKLGVGMLEGMMEG
jgi:hypothetical protein